MRTLEDGTRIIWEPLKGSQTLAMSCPASVILVHGTRGPGKTDSQLMRFRRRVGQGYGRFWRGVIFDRQYKNLDDLISKSMRWFPEFRDGAKFISSKSDYKWVWPTGEELLFRAVSKASDYWSYHGQEFPFIGWNEITKYPTEELYEAMMSCNRSSFRPEDYPIFVDGVIYHKEKRIKYVKHNDPNAFALYLPEIPLEIFATTNPYGAGHNWVKEKFIDIAEMGQIVRNTTNVFNPRTQQREDITKTQVHIFGSYRENKYLSPEYVAQLESITDPNKREAWLKGNWDITAGGMFDDLWNRHHHVVTPFKIPITWKITRSFDYGSSRPFSVGWWAVSDGSDYTDYEGNVRSTVRGDIFRIGEWYGSTGKTNEGLKLLADQISAGIIERQLAMGIHDRVVAGPADNSIWDDMNGNSIAADMQKAVKIKGSTKLVKGVSWIRCDKSRKEGWLKTRKYLRDALPNYLEKEDGSKVQVPRDKPGCFVFNTCKAFIKYFPVLPRDEEDMDDVDTESEDHIGDEVRYFIMSLGIGAKNGKTKGT